MGSSTLGAAGTWFAGDNSNNAGSSSATVTSVVEVNGAAAGNPNLNFYIDGLTLDPEGSIGWTGNAGGNGAVLSIAITETFCVGQTTTTDCPAADMGKIIATESASGQDTSSGVNSFTFQCSTGASGVISCGSSTANIETFLPTSMVAISEQVVLTQDANLKASLDLAAVFSELQEGAETPEPSTAALCGIALLGIGVRLKRRRDHALSVSNRHF
jgi:hypothetical protein